MARGFELTVDFRSPATVVEHSIIRALTGLCLGIAALALVAALAGLFWGSDGAGYEVVTHRGATVEIDGSGLYANDSILKAGANRGSDVLTIVLGIPLLLGSLILARRESLRGMLVLMGTLVYFLYVYASMSLGTAYNQFFLLYVALFGASLAAFILTFVSIDRRDLAGRMPSTMRHAVPGWFMIVSGAVTLVVWLMEPVTALVNGNDPTILETSTTLITHALDIAIIVPAAVLAGWLILRRVALGYLIAVTLLVLEIMLAPMIALQTVFQLSAGVTLSTAEIIGPIGGFVVISLLALGVLAYILRELNDDHVTAQAKLRSIR